MAKEDKELKVSFSTLQLIAMGFWLRLGVLLFAACASLVVIIAGVFLGLLI
jgi:hypothetical protein